MADGLLGPGAGLDNSEPVAGLGLLGDEKPKGFGARGLNVGAAPVKAIPSGLRAIGARIVGAPEAEAAALAESQRIGEAVAPDAMKVEDVGSVGEAVDFAKYGFASAVPSWLAVGASALGGFGVGGIAAKAAKAILGRALADSTRKLVLRGGATAGAGAGIFALEAANIFPEAVETGVENPVARTLAGAAGATALDIIGPAYLASRVLGRAAAGPRKAGFGAVARGAVKEGIITAGIESNTEMAQTAIERVAAGKDLTSDEALSELLNSFVIGGISGVGLGGGVGTLTTAARPTTEAVARADETAARIQRDADDFERAIKSARLLPEPPLPLPSLLPDGELDQRASDIALLSSIGEQPQQIGEQVSAAPITEPYRRSRSPFAEDADLNTLGLLRAQREDVTQRRTALAAELALPGSQRRPKSSIIKDDRALTTQIGALDTQIGQLEQQLSNRTAILETPDTVKPKGKVTPEGDVVPQESGAFKRTLPDVARPPAQPIAIPEREKTGGSPRERIKFIPDRERAQVIEGVVTESVDRHVAELGAAKGFRQGTQAAAVEALKRAAVVAARAPTIEAAEKAVYDAAIRALAGKVNKADAETFATQVAKDVRSAPTFYSKGAVGKQNFWESLPAAGYSRLDRNSPRVYKSGGSIYPTYERNGVRVAFSGGQSLMARRGDVFYYDGTENEAVVVSLVTDPDVRRSGKATKVMQDIVAAADASGKTLYLEPTPIKPSPMTKAQLAAFYKKFGFEQQEPGSDRVLVRKPSQKSRAATALAPTKVSDLLAHVPAAARMHSRTGGSSTNLVTGQDLAGTDNYAVSIYKDRELKIPGQPTEQQIRGYVEGNADLLAEPRHMLGTWYNDKDGYTYVDVSVLAPTVDAALQLGRENQQLAVFHLKSFDTIPVGSAEIFDLSHVYNAQAGLPPAVAVDYLPVPVERMQTIAQAYEQLEADNSADEGVRGSYEAFAREIEAQYALAEQHVKIEPWTKDEQPYANSAAMMEDVTKRRHLWVFANSIEHPLLTNEQNYKFRAIHDVFGHAKTGFEFGSRGELNATRAHAQMFSQEAWPALVTETLGQNAWVNYSEHNKGKPPAARDYAQQKADLLPLGLWHDLLAAPAARDATADQVDLIAGEKGQQILSRFRSLLGDDPNLEVRLYQAEEGEPVGSYTRADTIKAIVSLAVNAKDALSVADHEAYHALEDRVLDSRERIVVSRALRPGTAMYQQLIARTRAYDLENKTHITDEIQSIPQEARAYGFEFWRRGELQAEGLLETAWKKIRNFLERIVNLMQGYGYQSIEDIYRAIELGQYAQRGELSRVLEADSDWAADVEPDVIPGLQTQHRKVGASSKAKGRPYWVQSGQDVARLRTRLKKLALEGEVGRQWHAKSAAAIIEWAKGDKALAAKLAALIANFSPRTPVGLDLKKAFTAFVQYEAKEPLNPGAPREHVDGARRILLGVEKDGTPAPVDEAGNVRPTGIKRENFFKNLMLGIDPVHYNPLTQGATIDMWMAHAFGYANDVMGSVNKSQYNYADAEVKRLAKELGWSVEETQAAIWIATKARGNSARSHIERHALRSGWYEQVATKKDAATGQDLFGEHLLDAKRVVKDDKQREFVTEWMRMSLINPISQEQLDKANYDYARAFEDIYAGKIDLSDRLDEMPYAITKPAAQDGYELTRQPTLFSRAAVADMDRQVRAGELEREQRMQALGSMLDRVTPADVTVKQLAGAFFDAGAGGFKRWWLANVSTGNFISRFSQGYANVQKALLTYVQRKSTLIAEGSRVALSEWHRASDIDTAAVGEVLLTRTERGYTIGSPEYQQLIEPLTDQQRRMLDQANTMIAGRLQHEFAVDQKTVQAILPAAEYNEWYEARQTQVTKLIAEGYVPERRYGDYTVHITLPSKVPGGKPMTLFYEQFEHEAAAKIQAQHYQEILAREAPDLKVDVGYRYRAERDTSLSIQQFMDTARRHGVELSQAERERIVKALVAADSSKRNRLMRRKNVPGYSRDITRVLHEFVVTTANKIAYNEMSSTINDALDGRYVDARLEGGRPVVSTDPQRDLWEEDGTQSGFYRNLTNDLADYVLTPGQGSALSQKLRGAAMYYFLGGSLAAGVVNSMSVPMNTIPWLSQATGYANAFTTTFGSWGTVLKNQTELRDIPRLKNKDVSIPAIDAVPGLRDALITAAEDGTTMDTEIHQIMGMSQGGLLAKSRKVQRAADLWMSPFRLAEQINRITTFVAAYRVGQENKLNGRALYQFAKDAVDNTQNQYNEVNRPGLARHDVWSLLFMFKSFPLFMLEMATIMYKQNPKSLVYFLLGLMVMTGTQGLPFAETIMDLIDTISQRVLGSPFNSRRAMRNFLKDASEAIVGSDQSELVLRGAINDLTGMSIASRVGLGDFVPGTRVGTADNDYGRTLADILGAPFSMLRQAVPAALSGAGAALTLDREGFTAALRDGGPTAVRNLIKAAQQYDRGYAEDMKGRKLVDVTGPEVFWQSIGFSSANLAKAYEIDRIEKQTEAFYSEVRDDFTKQLVKAVRDGDAAKAQETMAAVQAWNAQYPEMPIGLAPAHMRRRIVEAGMTLNERTLRNLPRALRGTSLALEGTGND